MNKPPCEIKVYGSDTVCHECSKAWNTGDDFDCPYRPRAEPRGRSAAPGLWLLLAVVIGLLLAFYNAVRWLG